MNIISLAIKSSFRSITVLAIACLILNTPLSASGNPVPGKWEKVVALEPGTTIIVHTREEVKQEVQFREIVDENLNHVDRNDFRLAGDRVWTGYAEGTDEAVFASLTSDGFLICSNLSGEIERVKLETIEKVILPKTGEYAREWALLGAVGGSVGGALISVTSFDDFTPTGHLLSALAGAGIGAVCGGVSGATVGSLGETIYLSPGAAREMAGK
jgi:hypothetical protein